MAASSQTAPELAIGVRHRISTLLVSILALIAIAVLAGLAVIAYLLVDAEAQIGTLRDRSLPGLVRLSQLSQESAASIAIAPALATNPTRFEFETLLSRIEDKRNSQANLLQELGDLITDHEALASLQKNSALLSENQTALTTIVRQQINVRKRLEKHYTTLRRLTRQLQKAPIDAISTGVAKQPVPSVILRLQGVLLDPVRARFSRNRREIVSEIAELTKHVDVNASAGGRAAQFHAYWSKQGSRMLEDKATELTNTFKIKALVEENSLIANRLLNSANTEFARANVQLTNQIRQIASATRYNLVVMVLVVVSLAGGAVFLWHTLRARVFRRLDSMQDALRGFAESRSSELDDKIPDEIGVISRAISAYMARIDTQEQELEIKTRDLESLSSRLAKYLSPQVYESIFSGKQQVAVSSTRKKLTVFFSDIVGFTELADQLESEELTQLLNTYLTEMSHIALKHGATIDKYIGDAIMAFFGDPESQGAKKDAERCVRMAVDMQERLDTLNGIWKKSGISRPIECRMGIHTGYCTVGNFGSEERMDYTIFGGTVNTASRLENVAAPGQILISYETFALVEDFIDCDQQGQIEVKGIAYPVTTYSVLGLHGQSRDQDRFCESQNGFQLEVNRASMNQKERASALHALQRAIRFIGN